MGQSPETKRTRLRRGKAAPHIPRRSRELSSSTFEAKPIKKKTANFITLAIFAPLLILAGVAGFFVPLEFSLTSGAPAYNLFHIVFGLLGLLLLWSKREWVISAFNAGFGLIDLYQAWASYADLPPKQYLLWTRVLFFAVSLQ